MKILNLYAGIGLNRALWENCEVTAVEINQEVAKIYQKRHKEDRVVIGDAHSYLLQNYSQYDLIWGSPPCQSSSSMMRYTRHPRKQYPDLSMYQMIIFLDEFFGGKYVIENVIPYYQPLIPPAAKIGRHYFWANFRIGNYNPPKYPGQIVNAYKADLEKWYNTGPLPNIYLPGSHDPGKILKNGVHPQTGLYILNCARDIITQQNEKQTTLF